MRPIKIDIDPANVSTTHFGNGVNATGGTAFTLAATSCGDSLAHQLSFAPSGSVTGNYSVTGTDADGRAQAETVATSTTNTVESSKYWLTVSEILAPAGIGAATIDIGFVDEVASQTIVLNHYGNNAATVDLDVTGTVSVTIQDTLDDIFDPTVITDQNAVHWTADANFGTKSADVQSTLARAGIRAIRILFDSYTSGAEAQVYITQSGITR